MRRKQFSDYLITDIDKEELNLVANNIGKTIISKLNMYQQDSSGNEGDSNEDSSSGGGGGGKKKSKSGSGGSNKKNKGGGGSNKDQENKGDKNDNKQSEGGNSKPSIQNKEEKLKNLEDEIKKIEDLIKEAKENGLDTSGLESLLNDLKKAKDFIESQQEDEKKESVDKGTKKKRYEPNISDGSGIDSTALNNNMEEQAVSGARSGFKAILSQLINDNGTVVSAFIEYILNVVVKKGLAMQSMFDTLDKTPESVYKPSPGISQRDKAPAQASRIEKVRSGSSDSRVITPVVRTTEDMPFAVENVKSIFISIDDSGSMHSYLNEALSYDPNKIISNPLIRNFNASFENNNGENVVSKIINNEISSEELNKFVMDIYNDIKPYLSDTDNNFLSILTAGIIGSLERISAQFDNFAGLIYAGEKPFKCLAGAPVLKKSSGGNYLTYDFYRYYENSVKEKYVKEIYNFISEVSGGNDPSYNVGLAWGKIICNMVVLSTAAHLYSKNVSGDKEYVSNRIKSVESLRYNWAIGLFHFTDLYYNNEHGFLKGFYDAIKDFNSNDISIVQNTSSLDTFKDVAVLTLPQQKLSDTSVEKAYGEDVEELFDKHLGLVDFANMLNLISVLKEKLSFKYENGLFKVYYDNKELSSVRIILTDVSIFCFGYYDQAKKYLNEEMKNFKELDIIRKTYSLDEFKDLINRLGVSVVYPSKLSVYQEDVITFIKIMLSIKVAMALMFDRETQSLGDLTYMSEAEKSDLFIMVAKNIKNKILQSYDTISNILDKFISSNNDANYLVIYNQLESNPSALNDVIAQDDLDSACDLISSYYSFSRSSGDLSSKSGFSSFRVKIPSFIF
ncbi:MAG: hypothetical protein QXS19_08445 [Candidatus Methanomethylicia archaeon]